MSVTDTQRAEALARFVARFDGGEYWLAHEELEALWLAERVDAYTGLIHLAAAFIHLQRGNHHGAVTKLTSGLARLQERPAELACFDLPLIRQRFEALLGALRNNDAYHLDPVDYRLAPAYSGPVDSGLHEVRVPYRVRRYAQGYRTGRNPKRRD